MIRRIKDWVKGRKKNHPIDLSEYYATLRYKKEDLPVDTQKHIDSLPYLTDMELLQIGLLTALYMNFPFNNVPTEQLVFELEERIKKSIKEGNINKTYDLKKEVLKIQNTEFNKNWDKAILDVLIDRKEGV